MMLIHNHRTDSLTIRQRKFIVDKVNVALIANIIFYTLCHCLGQESCQICQPIPPTLTRRGKVEWSLRSGMHRHNSKGFEETIKVIKRGLFPFHVWSSPHQHSLLNVTPNSAQQWELRQYAQKQYYQTMQWLTLTKKSTLKDSTTYLFSTVAICLGTELI